MKVISLLQPWATLCVLGFKKIETRSWNTKYRGDILIHASAGKAYKKIPPEDPLYKYYHLLFAHNKIDPIEKLPFGAIIGKVNILETMRTDLVSNKCKGITHNPSGIEFDFTDQELAFGDYSEGRYGWLLSKPVAFENPISAKGQLNIWNYSDGILIGEKGMIHSQ